ncbi:MAG TPA: phospho-N-acetylmuramoyl-pentapeptide-transferase [Paludibacteraceae bacterium]|nr:phospho-N-acetylmuramoyl-pentapeptide-transferase [Paludibacteraceae bacterium]HQB68524.1 phospho-N-acetylmuramoyl-pentapeptide-transferase [Paludibacteraceae bacterium]HRS67025.1 phospho-N-acetylmuramoyl-pentapeptide-transferase [Paludibacteraceae bacterium]
MLYYLFNYLDKLDVPGAGMFNYISFRAALAFLFALIFATLIGRKIIDRLQKMQIGETIRDLDLEGQMQKKGTPTMGGIIILLSILLPCLFVGVLHNIYMILMLVTTVWLGLLGFADDYIKVFKKDKNGLRGVFKIIGQVSIGLIVGLTLYFSPDAVIVENVNKRVDSTTNLEVVEYSKEQVKSTKTTIPFFKNNNLDYADAFNWAGEHKQLLGWILFVVVVIFVVTAVSNGANLTDGLDGLATGTSAIQGATLGILAYVSGNVHYSGYLNIMYIPGSGELLVFSAAFIGATIGFLWFNSYPAQVFMGDTGSLALGGIIAVFAIAIHKELLIPILSGIFLVESLSVILQTAYFKYTKKRTGVGKRIFKMSPLHHHYQKPAGSVDALIQGSKQAIPESKITVRFWIVGLILAAITIITLKIR